MGATPSEYFDALHKQERSYSLVQRDFLPYGPSAMNWWTGFYTSRPALKGHCRYVNHQSSDYRLGALMKEMLSHEDLFENLFDSRMGVALDTRVSMLLRCVDECIEQYGRENVLLNLENTMSPRELVAWFVENSEYKNQNGKEGPSNLEFLDQLEG